MKVEISKPLEKMRDSSDEEARAGESLLFPVEEEKASKDSNNENERSQESSFLSKLIGKVSETLKLGS